MEKGGGRSPSTAARRRPDCDCLLHAVTFNPYIAIERLAVFLSYGIALRFCFLYLFKGTMEKDSSSDF